VSLYLSMLKKRLLVTYKKHYYAIFQVKQHKIINNYNDLITILRANFGNNYSETYLSKQLNSIIQNESEKVQDYVAIVELALYWLINKMTKNASKEES